MVTKGLGYNPKDPRSIERYAKLLIGHTFQDIYDGTIGTAVDEPTTIEYANKAHKGGLGNLLEEKYFGYKANGEQRADFEEAGLELKASPYELTKKGEYRAGERLVLSMINYNGPVELTLEESHMWQKSKLLLLIYYHRDKTLLSNLLYKISFVSLFTPDDTDLVIIRNDYQLIISKVIAGKAEEISEADTFYLGACTKGTNSKVSVVNQWYPPHTPAMKRAFCYKNSYMTYVLNEYVIGGRNAYDRIIGDASALGGRTFSQYIIDTIAGYRGRTDRELCQLFDREYNNNKAQWVDLAYRMLGIRSNQAEEFVKANIVVRAIRLEADGKMRESISFPTFKYCELANEEWDSSTLRSYFEETKLLFVVFKKSGSEYVLKGAQLWNMPYNHLEGEVRKGWQAVVDTINQGVKLTLKETSSGVIVENNFPKKADNDIIHIRPHASKRYFEFPDGRVIGDGNRSFANQLPDGTWMPNYSFWINNSYVLSQLNDDLRV